MNCDFNNPSMQCVVCGFVAPMADMRRNCPGQRSAPTQSDWRGLSEIPAALASIGEPAETLGLGDLTAKALEAVGITKERWASWWGEPCGCDKRQEKLNQVGRKIVDWIKGSR